jgi:hypothetical protein
MAWETKKTELDIDTYIAELTSKGALSLTNDHVKDELDLSPRATYDLLVFLHKHAAQIYNAVREPREVYPYEDHKLTIVLPSGSSDGEAEKPEAHEHTLLYGDSNDPLLLSVYDLTDDWAEHAYNGPAIVSRIESIAFTPEQLEPKEPEVLRGLRGWDLPEGTPDQAWKVTLWPQWGYKNFTSNHLYVHQYGDRLWTARSEWQSGTPHYLWLLNEDDLDEETTLEA